MLENLEIRSHRPSDAAASTLIAELNAELKARYPADIIHELHPGEERDFDGVFLIAWVMGTPLACGALRPLEPGVCELKRVYVRYHARRNGLARKLLEELERLAVDAGYSIARVETGSRQPEAVRLYEAAGYSRIPAFGQYATDPLSICFEKTLRPAAE
jgi:putative acetyltransferase